MLIYQEFLAQDELNEEISFDPRERLRFAVHEIVMKMKTTDELKFGALSKILKSDFNIDISEDTLKEIFDRWDKHTNADYTYFKKEDKNWMDAWAFQGYIKRKMRDTQQFGKHRRKKNSTTYSTTYTTGRNYSPTNNRNWEDPYGHCGWD